MHSMALQGLQVPARINSEFLRNTVRLAQSNSSIEIELACKLFEFDSLEKVFFSGSLSVCAYLQKLLPSLVKEIPLHLHEAPFLISEDIAPFPASFTPQPLNAVNTYRVNPTTYLCWSSQPLGNMRQSHVSLVIIDIQTNKAILASTNIGFPHSACHLLHSIFSTSGMGNRLCKEQQRSVFLKTLTSSTHLVHCPARLVKHFGHYVLNDLSHIANLDYLGLTTYFDRIFRNSEFDYFDTEATTCFGKNTGALLDYSQGSTFEIQQQSIQNGYAVVCSKDSTVNGQLWRSLRSNLSIDMQDSTQYAVCIGIRGGTREALNICRISRHLAIAINRQTSLSVHFVIDGLAQSKNNNISSTANLSELREHEIANSIAMELMDLPFVTTESVVGMKLIDQLQRIGTCRLAFGHSGSSLHKHMNLAGLDCIIHGSRAEAFSSVTRLFHDEVWNPKCIPVPAIAIAPDHQSIDIHGSYNQNYSIDEELFSSFAQHLNFMSFRVDN